MNDGGYYVASLSQAEIDRAFDRAATILRRPAAYALTVTAGEPSGGNSETAIDPAAAE